MLMDMSENRTVFVAEVQNGFDSQEILGVYGKADSAKQACQDRYETHEKTSDVLVWETSQHGVIRFWWTKSKDGHVAYRVDEYAIED